MKKISIKSSKGLFISGILHQNETDTLIILVHGFKDNMNLFAYKQLSISLSKHYSVFRFTFPDVETNTDNFNLIDEVGYLNEVILYFSKKYKKIILVGGSLGALVCSITAADNKKFDGLITLNGFSYFWGINKKFNKYLALILLTFPFNGPYAKMYKYYKKHFIPEKISVETLVITSEKDEMINYKQSLKFFSSLTTNKKIEILKDADHGLTKIQYVNDVSKLIVNWLEKK
ncbi:MAG: alpha/beta family hydrolase [Patescibacteria group bacterium]